MDVLAVKTVEHFPQNIDCNVFEDLGGSTKRCKKNIPSTTVASILVGASDLAIAPNIDSSMWKEPIATNTLSYFGDSSACNCIVIFAIAKS